jgi:hypothetical protein
MKPGSAAMVPMMALVPMRAAHLLDRHEVELGDAAGRSDADLPLGTDRLQRDRVV